MIVKFSVYEEVVEVEKNYFSAAINSAIIPNSTEKKLQKFYLCSIGMDHGKLF